MRQTGGHRGKIDTAGRAGLAGVGVRQGRVGEENIGGQHGATSSTGAAAFLGCKSAERTIPAVTSSIRAATRIDGPRVRKRSLRTPQADMPPIRSAITESVTEFDRIHSLRSMMESAPKHGAMGVSAETLADAMAVFALDLVSVLSADRREEVLERLANRLDDRGRTPNGTDAARLLGQVSASLMRMGA